ncbi:hypothetical protein JTE90_009953 [Oedothorax gibbosus]|uniref:WH2 domain-containing protein n=1 Tax=Oedothorax gibbosus TaxID=931172 RepID=A0AAV6V8B0_9ARAC|nr:hypothetical protein JTE90_009953 [Oedothorax gibbosus]
MPGGRTKFQSKWLEVKDGNGNLISDWCTATKSEYEAYCLICKTSLSVSNSGIAQLQQHALRQKHATASKQIKGQKILGSSGFFCSRNEKTSKPRSLAVALTTDQLVTKAEAIWAMKVADANYSFKSCVNITSVFKLMFKNHPIVNGMQLSERKLSYVLSHGLGPYFLEELMCDIKASISFGNFFSISFDETTTSQVKKQLDIHVRFWNEKLGHITPAYLTSIFLGHADADKMCKKIMNVFQEHKLPLKMLLMLSMDGPRVNLLLAKKVNAALKDQGCPELVNVDTCTLHKVHNCFSKALENLPFDIDEFATDLFGFFKLSAARREDLLGIEKLLECEEKFLIRHVSSRWLSLGPVISRILNILPALEEYFLNFLPKLCGWSNLQKNGRYKRIVEALKNKETVAYLEFISSLTPTLQAYLETFQGKGPLVHLLYVKMMELFKNILVKYMVENTVSKLSDKQLLELDLEDFKTYRKLKDLEVGVATQRALSVLSETDAKSVRMAIRSCLVVLSKQLKKTLPFTNVVLKHLKHLHPANRRVDSNNAIRRLCLELGPLGLEDQVIDLILLEWRVFRHDAEVDTIYETFKSEKYPLDVFWGKVMLLTDEHSGKLKYKNLSKLIKSCLSIYHGNADVERGFSLNNNIVSDNRCSLAESTIVSIRRVQDAIIMKGAYEKHNRPSITSHTFRPLQNSTDSQLSISGEMDFCPDFPPEDFADDCSEEATPTHKAYPPPLPLRAEEMELSAPNIPPKPRVLSQPIKRQDSQLARNPGNEPIYVNASDICSASNKPNTPVDPELSPKTSFQKSLAATLAQNAVQQKLLKETASNIPEQRTMPIESTEEGACGGNAPPPPVRRSSAPKQPPMVPPHRTPKHAVEGSSKESTSWNVFNESQDDSTDDAHAQLMRALNARLDALQQAEEGNQLPVDLPPLPTEPDRLPTPKKDLTLQVVEINPVLEVPPRHNSLRSAPVKKLPRTPDKSTLLSDLEMKFSRRDHGYKGKSDQPPAVIPRQKDAISKFHTAPRPPLETKAQRRISQPTFSELLDRAAGDFPRSRGASIEEAVPPKRLPLPPDRRSSLDLEAANATRNLNFEASSRKASVGIFSHTDNASKVQKWLAGRSSMDVTRCRADLLGEIREGVNLRKASSDDRSAPILRHPKIKLPK